MGRNLTGSLISSFVVRSKGRIQNVTYDVKKNKEEVLKELSKMINLDFFKMKEIDDGFYFEVKEEVINKYFVDYMKELNTIDENAISKFLYRFNYKSNKIDSVDGKIKIVNVVEPDKREHTELQIEGYDKGIREDSNPIFPDQAYFLNKLDGYHEIKMKVYYFAIIFDFDKYDGEDEWYMCNLLNKLVRLGMKNPLKDITFFCVSG